MFSFKRKASILAVTIALAQVITVTPVYATETEGDGTSKITCKHENCNNEAESESAPCDECKNAFFNTNFYESQSDEQHAFAVTCACGGEFSGEEPHWDYNNGVCICGYELTSTGGITCKHESCDNPSESESAPCEECKNAFFNEEFYESKNDEEHSFMVTCVCGDVFSGTEPHWNYNSGECICGYELKDDDGNSTGGTTDSFVEEPVYENINVEEERNKAIAQAVEEKIKTEEALPVTAFVSTEAVNALPAEVKGEAVTDKVFNVSEITTTRGFVAAVDKIVKTNLEDKNVTFYSTTPFAFNVDSLAALFNANKEFVYMFSHNGHLYKITIPAGAKIDLAGEKFAGPLFIGAKLGTSVLVK